MSIGEILAREIRIQSVADDHHFTTFLEVVLLCLFTY